MHRIPVLRGIAVLALAALGACDGTRGTAAPEPAKQAEEIARLVEAMGFSSDGVKDFGDYVLVEGDIMITKAQLRSATPRRTNDPMGPRFQYRTTSLVGSPKVHQITVDLSGLASQPGWQEAAAQALTQWSGISDSYVRMVQGSPGDVTVTTECDPNRPDRVARARWPAGGNPGSMIWVNLCFAYSTTDAQKLHNMVHELGHTLGFRHTNWQSGGELTDSMGAVHIPGTPTGSDNGSVMNGGTALNSWAGFSAADLYATRILYPLPMPTATVSNSGGTPLVSWGALVGANSYTVSLITTHRYEPFGERPTTTRTTEVLATTAGTSFLDAQHSFTGISYCDYGTVDQIDRYSSVYEVSANYATGQPRATVAAPIRVC